MTTHDKELRRAAVELFDAGHGRESASRVLGLSPRAVEKWLQTYRSVGAEVLLDMGRSHRSYPYELKLEAARAVVDGGMAKPDAMREFQIASKSPLDSWCRAYREGGAEALRPKPKGRPRGSKAELREKTREEELEARVRCLEAENAYLKKLAALEAEKRLRAGRRPR